MSETKVYSSVCRCVAPPFSPAAPHIQSCSWGWHHASRKHNLGPLRWTLGTFCDGWCPFWATLALLLIGSIAKGSGAPWLTAPELLLWTIMPPGPSWDGSCCRKELLERSCGVWVCVSVYVSFLNRHSNLIVFIELTFLLTKYNDIFWKLLNMLFLHTLAITVGVSARVVCAYSNFEQIVLNVI